MKDEALQLAAAAPDPTAKLNLLREYLQAFTLRSWHESEAFQAVAFLGGTSLRFLHNLARFSEDLDFSITDSAHYRPLIWMEKLKRDLLLAGFQPDLRWNENRAVHSGWIRVTGLLHEAGISPMASQKLSIKVEIDSRPPSGARVVRTIITRRLTFALSHYDLPSLMAGKLHALLARPYAKGRDWYDLVWYLSHRPAIHPNIQLLQNALDQTPDTHGLIASDWQTLLVSKLATVDCAALAEDVAPFLERPAEAALLTSENLRSLLHGPE